MVQFLISVLSLCSMVIRAPSSGVASFSIVRVLPEEMRVLLIKCSTWGALMGSVLKFVFFVFFDDRAGLKWVRNLSFFNGHVVISRSLCSVVLSVYSSTDVFSYSLGVGVLFLRLWWRVTSVTLVG